VPVPADLRRPTRNRATSMRRELRRSSGSSLEPAQPPERAGVRVLAPFDATPLEDGTTLRWGMAPCTRRPDFVRVRGLP